MKITIEVDDLTLFTTCFNNAIVAYAKVLWGAMMGCDVPEEFKHLKKLSDEELKARSKCLKDVYKQIEKIESEVM